MTRLLAFLMLVIATIGASPADAGTCTAVNQFNFTFASQAAANLAYGSSYNYTATTSGGGSRAFTMQLTQNGLASTTVNGTQLPAISTLITGTDTTLRDLVLGGIFGGRTASITGTTNVVTATFTFAVPIRDFTMTVHDIDFAANQYRDLIQVTGVGSAVTYTPALSSPAGNNNGSGSRTAAASSLSFGPVATPTTITAAQAVGVGASDNNSNDGTITASFAQPVTTVTVRYGNAPYTSGENTTGQQGIGIAGISFCPMPQLTVTKSSSPMSGTFGAYNLPGNDVLYTLTVTNSGASPVDASSIVLTDILPTGITFRNTALAPSSTPFSIVAGSSGVALSASSPAYSNNGGSTYTYTPASGYDANVSAVRVTPTGTMAANSSFAITFVARIN
ncbi:hypothetical protein [Sphingomonas bacterium]|uniref:hypothetical protein n=1 Tax=Sphingomonas bacterium TaxID=1895847 RepID=UPI0026216DCE|nr:hypothetical protein [Sphingomonas bacterium]MDB5678505.1 hypothetical protein [Sphingomonas bacterium]